MNYSILHLTDFHLNSFEGESEHLRRGFYQEYVDDLLKEIFKVISKVDFLVLTGDFIDQGRIENFVYVTEIVEYLRNKLNLNNYEVCVCIGNHDYEYKKELEDGSNSIEIRAEFKNFSNRFITVDTEIVSSDRVSLKKLRENVFYLSIDSTLGSHLPALVGKPGKIEPKEIDFIVTDVIKKHVPVNAILLIGCHYPIVHFPNAFIEVDEPNWSEKHFWSQAQFLRSRINKIEGVTKFWFLGDSHSPDHLIFETAYFVMTGKFGGTTLVDKIEKVSHINRQCKLITINNSNIEAITFNYEMETHVDSAMHGIWHKKISVLRSLDPSSNSNNENTIPGFSNSMQDKIILIKESIQEIILEKITKDKLYSFGRFITSNNSTSLGWISINQLLNQSEILSNISSKAVKYIQERIEGEASDFVLIGLDFWGGILSSQVSVCTGIQNFVIATRGNGQFHTINETNNNLLLERLKNVSQVIIVIDVVSCGETLRTITELIKSVKNDIKFHAISVISNKLINSETNFVNLTTFCSFCKNLEIPIIPSSFLPSKLMVPPNIDFSLKGNFS